MAREGSLSGKMLTAFSQMSADLQGPKIWLQLINAWSDEFLKSITCDITKHIMNNGV